MESAIQRSQLRAYGAIPPRPGPPDDFVGPRLAHGEWRVAYDGRFQHFYDTRYCYRCAGTGLVYQPAFFVEEAVGGLERGHQVIAESLTVCPCIARHEAAAKPRSTVSLAYLEATAPTCGACRRPALCLGCGKRACACPDAACACKTGEPVRCPFCAAPMASTAQFRVEEHRGPCKYAYQRRHEVTLAMLIGAGILDVFGEDHTPAFLLDMVGVKYKPESWVDYAIKFGILPHWPAKGDAKLRAKARRAVEP